jgi:hypothetical protein
MWDKEVSSAKELPWLIVSGDERLDTPPVRTAPKSLVTLVIFQATIVIEPRD